jgi:ABC-type cobalamin/Fe3+-siderophores transport system ATPase subunit
MNAFLQVQSISYAFPNQSVLGSVSFDASGGEFIALMGCNGAGKSTLMDIVAGLGEPNGGTVLVAQRPLPQWPSYELAHQISHLPQSIRADIPFSVEQLVLMGRYPYRWPWFDSSEDREAAKAAMQRTQCWDHRERRFFTLSGGERQRALLAACLAQQARILLMDEPSVFLDIDQQLRCFALLQEEARDGKICIAVTHDINLALTYCSRLLILSERNLAVDVSTSKALESTEWLQLFSPRLQLGATPQGKPWVWYQ